MWDKLGSLNKANAKNSLPGIALPSRFILGRHLLLVLLVAAFVLLIFAWGSLLYLQQLHRKDDLLLSRGTLITEIQKAHDALIHLSLGRQELAARGNWIALHSALHQPLLEEGGNLAHALERWGDKAASEPLSQIKSEAAALETSLTYALLLHLAAYDLLEQTTMPAGRAVELSPEELATSPSLKFAKSQDILNSPEISEALRRLTMRLMDLGHSIQSRTATDVHREAQVALMSLLLVTVVFAAVAFLLWYGIVASRQTRSLIQTLIELGERLAGCDNPREAAEALAAATDRLVGWDAFGLSFFEHEHGTLRDVLWVDLIDGERRDVTKPDDSTPLTPFRQKILEGQSFLFTGPISEEPVEPFGSGRRSQSSLFVPVRSKKRVLGFVTLQSYKPYAYTLSDLELVEWLAARMGAAFERTHLSQRLRESEERYRLLVETSLDGIFMADQEQIYFMNRACAAAFGYDSPEDLIGRVKPADLISPDQRETMMLLFRERLEGKRVGELYRWKARRKDGKEIFVESLATPVEFQGKRVLLGTLRDITDRELARQELEKVHHIYQQAIQAAGAVPYRLEFSTGRYEFPSEAIKELTGFSAQELTWEVFAERIRERRTIFPVVDPEELERLAQLEQSLPPEELARRERLRRLTSGEANLYRAEYKFERKDGRLLWILDSAVMETGGENQVWGSVGILQDITSLKRLTLRMSVTAELTSRLAAAQTAYEAAKLFVDHVRRLISFDSCSVMLTRAHDLAPEAVYAEDIVDGERKEVAGPPTISEAARKAMQGHPQLILRKSEEEAEQEWIPFGNTKRRSLSIIIVPLRIGDNVVGLAGFHSYAPNAFSAEDLEDLTVLGEQCAAAVERVLLFEKLAANEEQLRALWRTTPIGMRMTDAEGIVRMVNPAYCRLVELPEEEILGKPYVVVYAPAEREHILRAYKERFAKKEIEEVVVRELELWDGKKRTLELYSRYVRTAAEEMLLSVVLDRTREHQLARELMAKQKELEQLASHDMLTGLKNRRLALELLDHEVERAKRLRHPICVLMIDLDHFKQVNDTYGHLTGDDVLKHFAEILQRNSRSVDIVARYGGEEFLVAMPETGLDGALIFAERLRSAVEKTEFLTRDGKIIHLTCSIGIAEGTPELLDIDRLLALADKALYEAKRQGRNRVTAA